MTPSAIQHGFKRITPANVLTHDTHPTYRSPRLGDKWVAACMRPQLDACVPEEIAFLFEVTRGSLVYAQFFLPLASLAAEQSLRVLEAGARWRCFDLNLLPEKFTRPKNPEHASFALILNKLEEDGRIPAADSESWRAQLFLRNQFSHHTKQTLRDLKSALNQIEYTAELLNRLFK